MNILSPAWLFARDQGIPTAGQIIGWWESRRFSYNLLVGLAGAFSCIIAIIMAIIVESSGREPIFPDPPLFALVAVMVYGIMANVCYTFGYLVQLGVRCVRPEMAAVWGRLSFAAGLIGSVILTLAPAVLIPILSIVQLLKRQPLVAP